MSLKLRIACAALLAATTLPAFALQLGEIQVKSALDQPLVAAIPLHPKSLTELDGLAVGLASPEDFTRAGLTLTATDKTLRFHVVTDANGQKLILVTSTEAITDPYLDFLVEVNTHEGKQLREFVALLNPVIEAPAPVVREAPVAGRATPQAAAAPPAELPATSAFPQPSAESAPAAQPVPPSPAEVARQQATPASASKRPGGEIEVQRGDTLSGIARQAAQGTSASLDQMMLALQAINPDAFFKHNINNLKAGAILRMPTGDELDQRSAAVAAAEVHRQVEAWRAAKPQVATIVAGSAAATTGHAVPKAETAAPTHDHLTLAPPSGAPPSSGRPGTPGVAGTGTGTRAGVATQRAADRDTLISLNQSNADLESRVHSLEDISTKTGKLLSLKDATIAELQQKLAAVQAVKGGGAGTAALARASAGVAPASAHKAAAPAPRAGALSRPWYAKPVAWIIAGLIVLALLVLGLLRPRRGDEAPAVPRGPLADPDDVAAETNAPEVDASGDEPSLRARVTGAPGDLDAHLALCRLYYAQADVGSFVATAEAMRAHVADPECSAWREVAAMGRELAPALALFEAPAAVESSHPVPQDEPVPEALPTVSTPPVVQDPAAEPASTLPATEPAYVDDPVDTKLDLARAYLDLDDPVSARAMLAEVLEEGSQTQQDEARRLLADVAG